ncbi:MAG: c-type cytochrome [Alphaproteobacteria bacterium]|nr:c-type cytochrome [Alphaproteobacteria bacterium]
MRGLAIVMFALLVVVPAHAQLRGHGGPVRALAVSGDGTRVVTGSFDGSAIAWSLPRATAERVLRFHAGVVNAVALLADGRVATAGQDQRIALWRLDADKPETVLEGHGAPVVALATAPDGHWLASASWDRTVRLWPLAGGAPRVLEGHADNVNAVAFTPDGAALVSAGYDLTLRIWPLAGGAPTIVTVPTPLNAVAVAPDGAIITAGADGALHYLAHDGTLAGSIAVSPTPIGALAIARDGARVAAVGVGSPTVIVDRTARSVTQRLPPPAGIAWSAAFLPDGSLLTGGMDGLVRRWDAASGAEIGGPLRAASNELERWAGERGAEVFRACVACHALSADGANRAGPSLAGLFGRKIASLPGYAYSAALKRLDIVWTPETVAKLFEVGPEAFTPGTTMPEQRIGAPEDRAALVEFLAKATQP